MLNFYRHHTELKRDAWSNRESRARTRKECQGLTHRLLYPVWGFWLPSSQCFYFCCLNYLSFKLLYEKFVTVIIFKYLRELCRELTIPTLWQSLSCRCLRWRTTQTKVSWMHPNQKAGFGKKGYFFVNHWVSKGDGQKMHPEKYFLCEK